MWSQSAHGNQLMASNSRCFVFVWISFFLFFLLSSSCSNWVPPQWKSLTGRTGSHRHTHTHIFTAVNGFQVRFLFPLVWIAKHFIIPSISNEIHRQSTGLNRVLPEFHCIEFDSFLGGHIRFQKGCVWVSLDSKHFIIRLISNEIHRPSTGLNRVLPEFDCIEFDSFLGGRKGFQNGCVFSLFFRRTRFWWIIF